MSRASATQVEPLPETQDLRGKRVLVMGLGTFGGGLGAARFCAQKGADVTVTDLRPAGELTESLNRLQDVQVALELGGHDGVDFTAWDMIVVNPAVPKESPYLEQAREAGVYLTSEMNLFMARCKGKTVGITGSNGKSTTTALCAHLIEGSDRPAVWVGGNIGRSLLENVDEIGEKDAVVLELSSFQLEDLHRIRKSPTVGVLLNLTPNHLDRHGNMEAYTAAKLAVFTYQTNRDITILNYDDVRVAELQGQVPGRLAMTSTTHKVQPGGYIRGGWFIVDLGAGPREVAQVDTLQLPGRHNRSNALAAIIAAMVMRTPAEEVARRLPAFNGVPHRLELISDRDTVKLINDSVSTTPESTIASVSAFEREEVWLIAGGADKGHDWTVLADGLADTRCAGVIGIGETGPAIVEAVRNSPAGAKLELKTVGTLEEAMNDLRRLVRQRSVVLLSPATSSYDQYRNFEERGEHFRELAKRWSRAAGKVAPRGRRLSPESVKVTSPKGRWVQVTPPQPKMYDGSRPGSAQPSRTQQPARPAGRPARPDGPGAAPGRVRDPESGVYPGTPGAAPGSVDFASDTIADGAPNVAEFGGQQPPPTPTAGGFVSDATQKIPIPDFGEPRAAPPPAYPGAGGYPGGSGDDPFGAAAGLASGGFSEAAASSEAGSAEHWATDPWGSGEDEPATDNPMGDTWIEGVTDAGQGGPVAQTGAGLDMGSGELAQLDTWADTQAEPGGPPPAVPGGAWAETGVAGQQDWASPQGDAWEETVPPQAGGQIPGLSSQPGMPGPGEFGGIASPDQIFGQDPVGPGPGPSTPVMPSFGGGGAPDPNLYPSNPEMNPWGGMDDDSGYGPGQAGAPPGAFSGGDPFSPGGGPSDLPPAQQLFAGQGAADPNDSQIDQPGMDPGSSSDPFGGASVDGDDPFAGSGAYGGSGEFDGSDSGDPFAQADDAFAQAGGGTVDDPFADTVSDGDDPFGNPPPDDDPFAGQPDDGNPFGFQ